MLWACKAWRLWLPSSNVGAWTLLNSNVRPCLVSVLLAACSCGAAATTIPVLCLQGAELWLGRPSGDFCRDRGPLWIATHWRGAGALAAAQADLLNSLARCGAPLWKRQSARQLVNFCLSPSENLRQTACTALTNVQLYTGSAIPGVQPSLPCEHACTLFAYFA